MGYKEEFIDKEVTLCLAELQNNPTDHISKSELTKTVIGVYKDRKEGQKKEGKKEKNMKDMENENHH